jgi:Transposase
MGKSRFTSEQINGILKERHAGLSVVDLRRKHGIRDVMFLQVAGQLRRHGCV